MKYLSEHHKTDRNRFTRMCIGEALAELLKHTPIDEIKISDIAERAGISRMTYYNYYHSKTDILTDYLWEIVKEYIAETKEKKDIGIFHDYAHILHCLSYFEQYAPFLLVLVQSGHYSIIINAINAYMLNEVYPNYPVSSVYELYYYSGALLNTFIRWIESEKKESPTEIAKIIDSLLNKR